MKSLFIVVFLCFLSDSTPQSEAELVEAKTLVTLGSVEESRHYKDEYLSFDYPEEVEVYFKLHPEGQDFREIEFLYWDDTINSYTTTGITFSYPYLFEEEGSSLKDLRKTHKYQSENIIIDGHRALKITTRDAFSLYIPGQNMDVPTYQLVGGFLNKDLSTRILEIFIESAELEN
ncbi:MAG: hypothetical protein AAB383_02790 [Patescibacteria group bacterium]